MYDDSMFATAWITICLLETFRYGNGPKPSEDQIMSAILAIREYHNKNVDFANSLMTFRTKINTKLGKVSQRICATFWTSLQL